MGTCEDTQADAEMCIDTHRYIDIDKHTYISIYTYIYIHIYTYIHTHTNIRKDSKGNRYM